MTASVCARCEAIVTTDKKMPTTPTKIPTRRVSGSAACSGVTSISGMRFEILEACSSSADRCVPRSHCRTADNRRACTGYSLDHMQAWIAARNAENAAAHDLDDIAECAHVGDEFPDLEFRAGEFDHVARRIGRQHLAAGAAHQRGGGFEVFRRNLQLDQQQLAR